jgi:hypothetical protein
VGDELVVTVDNVGLRLKRISPQQHEVQERELALVRAHEARVMERETAALGAELGRGTAASAAIARMSGALRQALRLAAGEDKEAAEVLAEGKYEYGHEDGHGHEYGYGHGREEARRGLYGVRGETAKKTEWDEGRTAAWALARESELARLERENEELRRLRMGAQV